MIKVPNPVREGLKRHRFAHDYFLELKQRANAGGLTAIEWDWYRARQKEWEPEELNRQRKETLHRIALEYARSLSIDELMQIVSEKQKDQT